MDMREIKQSWMLPCKNWCLHSQTNAWFYDENWIPYRSTSTSTVCKQHKAIIASSHQFLLQCTFIFGMAYAVLWRNLRIPCL